ncbi:hypothetical protein [Actinomadura parmotrematis]|uniref:PH domain-containing protein n=1 Tax=Actinomadura parmotrematis TaxID=2864039 RepID=A0ABS7G4S2_9ACTN|nr:hypothetical protein [Actinomadura parmotrematis]MBW8487724.1 hypothetical protein [Actinomadura parmotrematis]
MPRTTSGTRVFAQPPYVRVANVLATGAAAFFILGPVLDRPSPGPIPVALAGIAAAAFMLIGLRAMLAQVAVTTTSLHYRGILRSHTVPLSRITGFTSDPSGFAVMTGEVPSVLYERDDGTIARITFWNMPVSWRARFGNGATATFTKRCSRHWSPAFPARGARHQTAPPVKGAAARTRSPGRRSWPPAWSPCG